MIGRCVFAALFSLSCVAVAAERDARGWLQGMVESVRSLNYRGTFVYLHDDQLESMHIVHSVDAGGEKEQLISLNGAAREIVRDDASVTCISPDVKSISVSRRGTGGGFRAVFSMDVDRLSEFYDFSLLHRVRVAGREAQAVAIIPKDDYRYGYRIYLDTDNRLPLKTDMLDESGKTASQIMFTSIKVEDGPVELTQASKEGHEYYNLVQREPGKATDEAEAGEWRFQTLPKGFQVRFRARIPGERNNVPVSHFVLSDGLASLSLYIEATGSERGLEGASRMGAVNAFGRVSANHQITAVGAVPARTVALIAGSVVPQE